MLAVRARRGVVRVADAAVCQRRQTHRSERRDATPKIDKIHGYTVENGCCFEPPVRACACVCVCLCSCTHRGQCSQAREHTYTHTPTMLKVMRPRMCVLGGKLQPGVLRDKRKEKTKCEDVGRTYSTKVQISLDMYAICCCVRVVVAARKGHAIVLLFCTCPCPVAAGRATNSTT